MTISKSSIRTAALSAAIALAFSSSAHADGSGLYGSVFVGGSFPSTANFDGNIGGAPQSVDTNFDTGYVVGGALGKAWSNLGIITPRTEIELSYRESDVDGIQFSGNGPAAEVNVSGDSSATTVFGNVFADLPIEGTRITPYVGVGVGVAFTDQNFAYGPGVRVNDSDEVFAAQAILGVSYDVTERFALTLDGRYQRDFGVESRRLAPTGAVTGIVEDDLDTFSVSLGLRAKF